MTGIAALLSFTALRSTSARGRKRYYAMSSYWFPPGGVAATHYRPGDEAIYMLQGSLLFEPDQGQSFELKAGEITFNAAKHIHKAKNTSPSEPAKVLNCMIAEKGQPLAVPVQ